MRNAGTIVNIIYWVPLILAIISAACGMAGLYQERFMKLFFIVLLCIAFPKLVFALVSIIGKMTGFIIPYSATIANIAGSTMAVVLTGMSVYGFSFGWKKFTVTEVAFKSSDIPSAFSGYRIIQLSDLHRGTFKNSPSAILKLIDKVNALYADMILFTGDLVNTSSDELNEFTDALSRLQAKDGVYSILGNHDYCHYLPNKTAAERHVHHERLKNLQREMGWKLLLNENSIIRKGESRISLIGVENDGGPRFPSYSDLKKAMTDIPDNDFKILMTHDPSHWRKEIIDNTNIQLTLSGHTHAMQFKIGNFSPSKWAYKEWGGLHKENDQHLYVNTGTGGYVPFRYGAWPEITLITLLNE